MVQAIEQVAMPVAHLRLPLARVARSRFGAIAWPGEDLRPVDLMERHEGRLRGVDGLEALTGVEPWDGKEQMLVGDVPGIPLGAPGGVEQRHLYHVDHQSL